MSSDKFDKTRKNASKEGFKNPTKPAQRRGSMKSISKMVPRLTRPITKGRGMAFGGLLNDWVDIMGPKYAHKLTPVKLSFPAKRRTGGTLTCKTASANALEIQHVTKLLIERINGFFGYNAVERLHLVHDLAALKRRQQDQKLPTRSLTEKEKKTISLSLEDRLKTIEDEELREILRSLGQSIMEHNRK